MDHKNSSDAKTDKFIVKVRPLPIEQRSEEERTIRFTQVYPKPATDLAIDETEDSHVEEIQSMEEHIDRLITKMELLEQLRPKGDLYELEETIDRLISKSEELAAIRR